MNIFSPSAILERKNKTASALTQVLKPGEFVLVFCGDPLQKPGGHDQTYPFLPHPDYFWLTGSRRPHGVSAFSVDTGWVDFVKPVSREEKIWEGGAEVIPGRDVVGLDSWLNSQNPKAIYTFGLPSRDWLAKSGDTEIVQEAFNQVRRKKDQEEVKLIRSIAHMASFGYKRIKEVMKPGLTERQIQLEYEAEVLKAGSEKFPYDTIVGAGTNAAILHAIPTSRILKSGDLVLVDAGADVADYCVDITRVFPVNGKFDSRQKTIYDLVLKAQTESIALCRPGVEWHDVHRASAKVMTEGLKSLGILKGDSEMLLETGATSSFFPHGVGHMVGLRVRDVGGKVVKNPRKCCGVRVRVDFPLEENFLMTVEPGLYFISALLNDEETRKTHKDTINWNEVEKWLDFGGVRIEDDILIGSQGPINLTSEVEKTT